MVCAAALVVGVVEVGAPMLVRADEVVTATRVVVTLPVDPGVLVLVGVSETGPPGLVPRQAELLLPRTVSGPSHATLVD